MPVPTVPNTSALAVPPGFCCPACQGGIEWHEAVGTCALCRRTARVLSSRLTSCLTDEVDSISGILGLPDTLVSEMDGLLECAASGKPVSSLHEAGLRTAGLIDASAALTAAGERLWYHFREHRLQASKPGLLNRLESDKFPIASAGLPVPRILDVGCGMGQTLDQPQLPENCEKVGVDIDLESLAFGARAARGANVWFVHAEATALPFENATFTHVLSRVTLNYVQQRTALREMVRVLRPGGLLLCRVEGPGYDVRLIRQSRSVRGILSRSYDFALGTVNAALGWQRPPGSLLRGGRCFASCGRIRKILRGGGCEILDLNIKSRRLGLPTDFDFVARKVG